MLHKLAKLVQDRRARGEMMLPTMIAGTLIIVALPVAARLTR